MDLPYINITDWCIRSFEETTDGMNWTLGEWNFKIRFRHLLCVTGILIPCAVDTILAIGATLLFCVTLGFSVDLGRWATRRFCYLMGDSTRAISHFFMALYAKEGHPKSFRNASSVYTDLCDFIDFRNRYGNSNMKLLRSNEIENVQIDEFIRCLSSDLGDESHSVETGWFETYVWRRVENAVMLVISLIILCVKTPFAFLKFIVCLVPIPQMYNYRLHDPLDNSLFHGVMFLLFITSMMGLWAPGACKSIERERVKVLRHVLFTTIKRYS